jgi:hypothetical protein
MNLMRHLPWLTNIYLDTHRNVRTNLFQVRSFWDGEKPINPTSLW